MLLYLCDMEHGRHVHGSPCFCCLCLCTDIKLFPRISSHDLMKRQFFACLNGAVAAVAVVSNGSIPDDGHDESAGLLLRTVVKHSYLAWSCVIPDELHKLRLKRWRKGDRRKSSLNRDNTKIDKVDPKHSFKIELLEILSKCASARKKSDEAAEKKLRARFRTVDKQKRARSGLKDISFNVLTILLATEIVRHRESGDARCATGEPHFIHLLMPSRWISSYNRIFKYLPKPVRVLVEAFDQTLRLLIDCIQGVSRFCSILGWKHVKLSRSSGAEIIALK